MTVWRYEAIPLRVGGREQGPCDRGGVRIGETSGESADDVRASLRRIGLQVITVRPIRRVGISRGVADVIAPHLRRRRTPTKAELFDALATLLRSGVPLLEAVATAGGSTGAGRRHRARRTMLLQLRESLRSGESLASGLGRHPFWFDAVEIAMIRAGQIGGTLPDVLGELSERHARSDQLTRRLIGALAYPLMVAIVGVAVVTFLSTRVLPDLVSVLGDADVKIPALTVGVMSVGRFIASMGAHVLMGAVVAVFASIVLARRLEARGSPMSVPFRRAVPTVVRRLSVARLALGLAALVRTGIPAVEAIRVIGPTIRSGSGLRRHLERAALCVERGDDLAASLDDPLWFDDEFRRLLEVGQASGELPALLERIGKRYERQAGRKIDQIAALLEPVVILVLAVLVGIVVMGAILPLIRLQEVL